MDSRSALMTALVLTAVTLSIVLVVQSADNTTETGGVSEDLLSLLTVPAGDESSELDEFVVDAIAFVEATRGQAFVRTPVVLAMADADFVTRVETELAEEFAADPEFVAEINVYYRALGLIDPDESIDEKYGSFGAAGILGFYDPETEELVVRQVDELSFLTKSTIVHELVHAFDDQHFDLDRPEYDDRTDEIPWTFAAIAEGNASFVEARWEEELSASEQAALLREELSFGDPGIFDEFTLAFLLLELSPYEYGEGFIAEVVGVGGIAAVDELLVAPPETSEQIIDPSAFFGGEPPIEVAAPPVPSGAEFVTDFVGGQVLLESLFTGSRVDFGTAADGWGGDRIVGWAQGDLSCIAWDLVADSETDLRELRGAFNDWAAIHPGTTLSEPFAGGLRVERCV